LKFIEKANMPPPERFVRKYIDNVNLIRPVFVL